MIASASIRIELDEASGQVSPRLQYALSIVIEDAVVVRSKRGPLGTLDTTLGIDDDRWRALEATLPDLVDLVSGEQKGRVNTIKVDDRVVRYLPSDLEGEASPAQAALRRTREAIFALAR